MPTLNEYYNQVLPFVNDFETLSRERLVIIIEQLKEIINMVETLAIFSANEELEDVNTTDLKFILVDAYFGLALSCYSAENRLESLKESKVVIEKFFLNCERLGFDIPKKINSKDMSIIRNEKIRRYKEMKMLMEEIKKLTNEDVEVEREIVIKTINLWISKCFSQLELIIQEIELLENKPKEIRNEEIKVKNAIPFNSKEDFLSPNGVPRRPFVLTNKRLEIRDNVFKPGYNLPTMSIDEYLQREFDRGNVLSSKNEAPQVKLSEEEERQKAINWDEFKDFNLRGMGNTFNRS